MDQIAQLRQALSGRMPLGFGISGALGTRLFSYLDVARLIRTAREAGISIFDTGPSYGAGLAERRLGRAIGNDPDAFVMTKAGLVASGMLKRAGDFAPASIAESVDQSLERLKRERIDLLWLHGPNNTQLTEDLFDTLEGLKRAGKVAAFGVASHDHSIRAQLTSGPFSAFMGPANSAIQVPNLDRAGPIFFGIETLQHVQAPIASARKRSVVWKAAKALLRGEPQETAPVTLKDAFDYAYQTAECDIVVTTTTKPERVVENARICEGYPSAPPGRGDLNLDLKTLP